jgi:uncharacterized protein (TIGR03118 family)
MRLSITLGCVLVLQLAACGGGDASAQLTFSPRAPPPPSGMTGVAYPAFTFAAPTGGIGPFSWSETGAFPPGLSLSPAGQLYGTPLTAGTFSFTLTVMDSSNPHQATTESVTLLVEDSPIVIDSTSAPPTGTQGVLYVGFAFTASGGSVPLTWSVTQGALPSGLTLNSDGTLSGTPLATGSATFTVTARDSAPAPQTASGSFTLGINPSAFALKKLVADAAGTAAITVDPNLVEPWGLVFAPGSAGAVANNGTSTSTQYDGRGVPQPTGSPLVVRLPSGPAGTPFQPTGMVANSTPDFVVGSGATAGAAQLIYAGASGLIAAWSPALGSSAAITYTDTAGAVYTGLALANNGSGNFLYAADFYGRKIDVFDSAFQKQASSAASFSFRDPFLPAAYAPFGIQAIDNGSGGAAQLYVSYAQPQGIGGTPVTGPGLGMVDVFTANGVLVRRLVLGGPLNAPWGLALAPTDFGTLGEPLLVGNLGDGKINAFDPVNGRFRGTLSDVNHNALSVPGLRGIAFGNDFAHQRHNALFFTAGPGDSTGGAYGRIDAAYLLEILSIQFNACGLLGCNPTTQVAISPSVSHQLPIAEMQFFINGTLYQTVTQDPFEVAWTPQANAEVRVTVIDVAGDVATSCQRFAATSPCSG